ncbi:helix-turn-helix domain-containing protein [Nocardioides rotundus]|uniref:helix-turn-helix domain-containing protein n=1 Tax=Nocardioides rotundus TaxID=1774216 RepID=UPI001CBDAB08|nr:helix-turn-helix domain-containing protein [Nocardioides rotundus]UAL31552.1 helix-turn-helix domain-containing protein [Nocardioides rotundus]
MTAATLEDPVPYVLTAEGTLAAAGLVTVRQAAAMLRVSSKRVRLLARKGELDGVNLGMAWLLTLDSVRGYVPARSRRDARTAVLPALMRDQIAAGDLLTSDNAARLLGLTPETVARLAAAGRLEGFKAAGMWLVEGSSVAAYAARNRPLPGRRRSGRPRARRLAAGPLVERVEGRGGFAACGGQRNSADEKAYERARRQGYVTPAIGDRLAVRLLGLTGWEVWEEAWAA